MASASPTIPRRVAGMLLPPFDTLKLKAAKLRADGHDVISLGQAVPGFGPPDAAVEAARLALSRPETHLYSADAGLLTLRAALCAAFRTHHQIEAVADEIIITAGGNQAFMLAAMTLLDPGDEVILPSPYFVNHEMTLRAIGAVPVEAPLDDALGFQTRWADIEPRITSRTRAIVLCTPANPTGAVIGETELTRIVHEAAARGLVLISDETYRHFMREDRHAAPETPGSGAPSAASASIRSDNVVVVGTFSKSFGMTGWRVGYMLAAAEVCEQALKIQDAMIICAPVISQIAAEAAVRESWNHAHAFDAELQARRAILADGIARIPQLHWTQTSGAFFAFVGVSGCTDSAALAAEILERAHVVTIPGAAFGRAGEGYLRLSYGAASREQLTEACERLRVFFAG
ncbi:MAG: aminotransferase class I/II-fold pyridoxal phosphate-dependent enzyme [Acidobacteriota bacterium]